MSKASSSDARIMVDLNAVADNYHVLKARAGSAVAPVVKGDAYGLGTGPVARRLWAEGARTFFVARVGEGERLRRALGPSRSAVIYVFDGCPPHCGQALIDAELTPVLNSLDQALEWRAGGGRSGALHIDTGMNRLGVRVEAVDPFIKQADLHIQLVMSHLACGATPQHPMNQVQADQFSAIRPRFADAQASLANTAGIFLGSPYRFEIARPGIGLCGGGPFDATHPALRSSLLFEAPILQIRTVLAGETVGYGATWRAERTTTVAIVAAGFADGVLRALGGGGYGWFAGKARPFLGRVSMDLIALDMTDCKEARAGAMVEMLGEHVRLDEVARLASTVAYEIIVRPASRVARVFKGSA